MSDLQCAARIVLARPSVAPEVLAGIARRENVGLTIRAEPAEAAVDLAGIADLHRGETVLVITDAGPHVDRDVALLLVEIDADGWRLADRPMTEP